MTDKTDNQEADSNKPTKNSKGSTEENLSKPALVTKSHDAAPDPTDPAKEASARQGTSTLFNAKPIPKMTAKPGGLPTNKSCFKSAGLNYKIGSTIKLTNKLKRYSK